MPLSVLKVSIMTSLLLLPWSVSFAPHTFVRYKRDTHHRSILRGVLQPKDAQFFSRYTPSLASTAIPLISARNASRIIRFLSYQWAALACVCMAWNFQQGGPNPRRQGISGKKCPWPFVLFHDIKTGLRDWPTWIVIALLLFRWGAQY